jgi:hypothetical protein
MHRVARKGSLAPSNSFVRAVVHRNRLGVRQLRRKFGADVVPPPEEKGVVAASGNDLHAEPCFLERLGRHGIGEANRDGSLVAVRVPLQSIQFEGDRKLDGMGVVEAFVSLQVEGFSRFAWAFSR